MSAPWLASPFGLPFFSFCVSTPHWSLASSRVLGWHRRVLSTTSRWWYFARFVTSCWRWCNGTGATSSSVRWSRWYREKRKTMIARRRTRPHEFVLFVFGIGTKKRKSVTLRYFCVFVCVPTILPSFPAHVFFFSTNTSWTCTVMTWGSCSCRCFLLIADWGLTFFVRCNSIPPAHVFFSLFFVFILWLCCQVQSEVVPVGLTRQELK